MTITSRGRALATITLLAAAAPAAAAAPGNGLTISPPAGAAAASAAPRGVFDVVIEAEGAAPVPGKLLVEQRGQRVEATLIVDQRVSAMRVVRSDARSLQASLPTTHGVGVMSLRLDGDAIGGTLTAKKQTWKVSGTRSL
jgi:hypothetical protein